MLLAGLLEEIAKKLNSELQFRALIGLLTKYGSCRICSAWMYRRDSYCFLKTWVPPASGRESRRILR